MDWRQFFLGDGQMGTPTSLDDFRNRARSSLGVPERSWSTPPTPAPNPASIPSMTLQPKAPDNNSPVPGVIDPTQTDWLTKYQQAMARGDIVAPPMPPQRPAAPVSSPAPSNGIVNPPLPLERPADLGSPMPGADQPNSGVKVGWSMLPGPPLMVANPIGNGPTYDSYQGSDGRLYPKIPDGDPNASGPQASASGSASAPWIKDGSLAGKFLKLFGTGGLQ